MAGKIKGITLEIGGDTTKLNQALGEANSSSKKLRSELKEVNSALKFDSNNIDLLKQKEKLLSDELDNQKTKLNKLKAAKKQADDAAKNGTEVNAEGYRKLQREISETEQKVKKLGDEVKDVGKQTKGIGALQNKFKNLSSTISGSLSKVKSVGSGIGKAFSGIGKVAATVVAAAAAMARAVVAAGKKFASLAQETAEYGDHIDKMSQKIGMSAEAYQKWDFVLSQNGMEVDKLQASMKKLSTAAANNDKAFKELGISEEYLKTASPEELFETSIEKLQQMEASTQRTAIASTLFGKSATELAPLLNQSAEATDELKKRAEEYGLVMSDKAVKASAAFQDSLDLMGRTATGLKNRLMAEFLPSLTQVTDGLGMIFKGDTDEGLAKISDGIMGIMNRFNEMLPKVVQIGGSILQALADSILQNLPVIIQMVITVVNGIIDYMPQITQEFMKAVPLLIDGLLQITMAIIENLPQIYTLLIEALPQIIEQLLQAIPQIITALAEAISDPNMIAMLIEAIFKITVAIVKELPTILLSIIKAVVTIMGNLLEAIYNVFADIGGWFKEKFLEIVDAAKSIIEKVKSVFKQVVQAIKNVFSNVADIGRNLVEGIYKGIINAKDWLLNKIKSWCKSILNGIKSFFGIASPSKITEEYGRYIVQGLAVGITEDMSAEQALETKLKNLDSMFKEYIGKEDLAVETAKADYELWESWNPNASEYEKNQAKRTYNDAQISAYNNKIGIASKTLYEMKQNGASADDIQKQANTIKGYITSRNKLSHENASLSTTPNIADFSDIISGMNFYEKKMADLLYSGTASSYRSAGLSDAQINAWARQESGYADYYEKNKADINVVNQFFTSRMSPSEVAQETTASLKKEALLV